MNPQIAYLLNLSIQQIQSERLEDAERSLNQIIKLQPKNADALCFLSIVAAKKEKWTQALELINKSIQSSSKNSVAHSNKGNILKELTHYEEALECYKKAIYLDSKHFEAHNNLGNLYYELGDYQQAILSYEAALLVNPNYAEAYNNKGNSLQKIGHHINALEMYEKAITIKRDYIDAWLNRSFTLNDLKRYQEALEGCDIAISINPNNPKAWTDKGIMLSDRTDYRGAIECFDKALSIQRDFFEAWADRGSALKELKRTGDALASYLNAYRIKPNLPFLLGDIVSLKQQMCQWDGLEDDIKKIDTNLNQKNKITNPFNYLSISSSSLRELEAAKIWVAAKFSKKTVLPKINKKLHKKIRIGYFSGDFRNHPVSFLTAELYELHDRTQFEIYAFSLKDVDGTDEMRNRLKQSFDHFIEVQDKTDIQVVELARDFEIDIAIDLGGHTKFSPIGVMSYRAAPIQVSYIGYLGTSGAEYMDYILADKILIPEGEQKFYSEKVAYLPSYQVNDSRRSIPEPIFTRGELGLPEHGFVFCCFNNNYKILPSTFDSWMRILKACDGSVLYLYAENPWVEKNLKKEAEVRGVAAERIIFGQRLASAEYLARYLACDLFLDTAPYNAGTTASDALWAGLPVLTFKGETFAGRMASSLLNSIGLNELITSTPEEYEELAIELANNPERLAAIKRKLADNRNTAPLFDTDSFTKNLEFAYIQMYRRYIEGTSLDHICI